MDLQNTTKDLLKQYKIKPDKLKSQNFLVNEKVYDDIVATADINSTDTILEIGPGLGFLTTRLLARAKRVLAVEVDEDLGKFLSTLTSQYDNFELENKNILGWDESKLPGNYKIVANLPYHLTGKILRKFLSSKNSPSALIVLVQKEVAERICATAGQHSLLSLSVQYFGHPEIVGLVGKDNFFPIPRVDSAILKIIKTRKPLEQNVTEKFWQIVRIGFSSKRKMLAHNLAAGLGQDKALIKNKIQKIGLKDKVRAQELSISDWERLIKIL